MQTLYKINNNEKKECLVMFNLRNFLDFVSTSLILCPFVSPHSCQDWDRQNPTQIVTEMCGFVTILSGTFLLHKTKDMSADGIISIFTF
jgi:Magnesium transporter NIPA